MWKTMIVKSPIGELTLVGSASALVELHLPGFAPVADAPPGETPLLRRAAGQLAEYFAGERRAFDLPLAPRGTPFQQRVWDGLLAIPYGELRSYGDLARVLGRPSASRAVGAANGRNPIAIVVPCHRVIGANGQLTGYAGGLPIKRYLIEHERRHATGQQRMFA
jgi:methylated-DNA-[protein]-cysteine S-methyltransferase